MTNIKIKIVGFYSFKLRKFFVNKIECIKAETITATKKATKWVKDLLKVSMLEMKIKTLKKKTRLLGYNFKRMCEITKLYANINNIYLTN